MSLTVCWSVSGADSPLGVAGPRSRSDQPEHRLNRLLQGAGDFQGDFQRRTVAAFFDGDDGLACHPHDVGQLLLGQVLLALAQAAHAVVNGCSHLKGPGGDTRWWCPVQRAGTGTRQTSGPWRSRPAAATADR